jgi:hypothetical protein
MGMVQTKDGGNGFGATPYSVSFTTLPTIGNRVGIAHMTRSGTGTIFTITGVTDNQGGGNVYTKNVQATDIGGTIVDVEVWSCPSVVTSAGTFTITATLSGTPSNNWGGIFEASGVGATDETATANGATTPAAVVTALSPNLSSTDVVVAMVGTDFDVAPALSNPATPSYTTLFNTGSGGPQANCSYKSLAAIETSSAAWTWTTTALAWAAALVTFKPSGGAAGPGPLPRCIYVMP